MEQIKKDNVMMHMINITEKYASKVRIGKGNVFHPGILIDTHGGEIIIGDNNIFEEKVKIYNVSKSQDGSTPPPLIIGDCNIFKSGVYIMNSNIGSYNIINERVYLKSNCLLKNGCEIAMGAMVSSYTKLDKEVFSPELGTSQNYFFNESIYKESYLALLKEIVNVISKGGSKTSTTTESTRR